MRLKVEFKPSFHRSSAFEIGRSVDGECQLQLKVHRNELQKKAGLVTTVSLEEAKRLLGRMHELLQVASQERRPLVMDGIRIRGQLELEADEATTFEFVSPRKNTAARAFVTELLQFVRVQSPTPEAGRYIDELEQYLLP
jgi:hypothetical protein